MPQSGNCHWLHRDWDGKTVCLFLKFDIHVTVSFAGVDPGTGGELFVSDDIEKPSGLNNYLIWIIFTIHAQWVKIQRIE